MNPSEHDADFELRLRRRERLVPQFDADLEGPDADVDRAVLARARTTLRLAPAARPRHYRAPRWMLPLALAATVLLSFTLVLQMDSGDVVPPRSAAPAVGAAREADAGAPVPAASTAPAAAAAEVVVEAAPAAAPAEPPPPPAPRALVAEPVAGSTAAAMQRRAERISDTAAAGESADAVRAAGPDLLEPAAWLEHIERLRTAGELAAARRELAAFRGRYPDFELPPALRALLEP